MRVRLTFTGGQETPEIRAYLDAVERELNARDVAQKAVAAADECWLFGSSVMVIE